jgi:hypothetical protein
VQADILIIREYAPDTERCLRALRALLAPPTKDADLSSPATVTSGQAELAKHSPARQSVAHSCARGKGRRGHAPR